MSTRPDAKWLREMTREVAAEPVPDLDWDKVEKGVFEALEEPGQPVRLHAPPPVWPRVAAVAGVAAGLALVVSWSASHTPELAPTAKAPVAAEQPTPPAPTAASLAGSQLVTEHEPLTVEHGGWATIRLAPDSRVTVQRLDERVALALDEGKVEAEVNRRASHEIFTVDVDGLRVAVRGTVFSVERRGDAMRVDVERGTVAVVPIGSGDAEGWLMKAPSTGTYSIEHETQLAMGPLTTEPPADRKQPDAAPPALTATVGKSRPSGDGAAAPEVDSATESLPESLTSESASSVLASIASEVKRCHRDAVPSSQGGVTIRAQTTITIQVAPDGHVSFARFDPPLMPQAQRCASAVVQRAQFPRARTESALRLPLTM